MQTADDNYIDEYRTTKTMTSATANDDVKPMTPVLTMKST